MKPINPRYHRRRPCLASSAPITASRPRPQSGYTKVESSQPSSVSTSDPMPRP